MKNFLVFGGDYYYPSGGWSDFQDSFDTLEEATELAVDLTRPAPYITPVGKPVLNHDGTPYMTVRCDWAQIVDGATSMLLDIKQKVPNG